MEYVAANASPNGPGALKTRLSVMMFLQYAIWGAWLPFLWSFLADHRGMSGEKIGSIFAAGAIGAIVGPFIAGQIADRYFSTERFLAISHLLGAVLIWQLARVSDYSMFVGFSLLYGLIYAPTLSLTNSLAFHHLPDRDRDFGRVRLWGTVGWIAVGITMGHWLALRHTPEGAADAVLAAQVAGKADAFRLSAILGLLMGLYCLTLPHTPPSKGAEKLAFVEAIREAGRQPLLVLFLLAVPVSCIHQFYFVHTETFLSNQQVAAPSWAKQVFGEGGGGVMTVGQMAEVIVLAMIPLVSKALSRKALLSLGLIAYAARMALFAYVDQVAGVTGLQPVSILIAGVALHGLCFGCFIFVAFMVVDENTTPDVRASAQSLFNLVIVGIGIIVGSMIAGRAAEWAKHGTDTIDYTSLFSIPMWASLVCLGLLLALYPGRSASERIRAYRAGSQP